MRVAETLQIQTHPGSGQRLAPEQRQSRPSRTPSLVADAAGDDVGLVQDGSLKLVKQDPGR